MLSLTQQKLMTNSALDLAFDQLSVSSSPRQLDSSFQQQQQRSRSNPSVDGRRPQQQQQQQQQQQLPQHNRWSEVVVRDGHGRRWVISKLDQKNM